MFICSVSQLSGVLHFVAGNTRICMGAPTSFSFILRVLQLPIVLKRGINHIRNLPGPLVSAQDPGFCHEFEVIGPCGNDPSPASPSDLRSDQPASGFGTNLGKRRVALLPLFDSNSHSPLMVSNVTALAPPNRPTSLPSSSSSVLSTAGRADINRHPALPFATDRHSVQVRANALLLTTAYRALSAKYPHNPSIPLTSSPGL